MNEVVALTAAGAFASLIGLAISVGRTVRKILAERKLVKKIATDQPPENSSEGEFTPWERKELLRPSTQPSVQGQLAYRAALVKQAEKLVEKQQQRKQEYKSLEHQTDEWLRKLRKDNEELLMKRRKPGR